VNESPPDDDGWSSVPPLPVPETETDAGLEAVPAPAGSADGHPAGHPVSPAAPSGRPAPQYGEYAPEGWVNPVFVEQARRDREAEARRREDAEAAKRWELAGGSPERFRGTGTVPPDRGATDGRGPRDASPAGAGVRRMPRDAVLTVLLLAFGLVSVIQQLSGITGIAGQVAAELAARYTALSDPHALVSAAATSAVGTAVLFVLAVWWSVVRLRRRKSSFWIPLCGAAIAAVFSTIVYVVVVMHDPAFAAYLVQHPGG
jgi:hypothetical protein